MSTYDIAMESFGYACALALRATRRGVVLDADDIRQEAWIGLNEAARTYRSDAGVSLASWVKNRAVQRAIDASRKLLVMQRTITKHQMVPLSPGVIRKCIVTSKPTLDWLIVAQAMESLTTGERRIIHLRYWEGMTQKEASAAIGLSQSRISQIESGAISKMQQILKGQKKDGNTEDD